MVEELIRDLEREETVTGQLEGISIFELETSFLEEQEEGE